MTLSGHRSSIYKLIDIKGGENFISLGGDGMVVKWTTDGDPNGTMIADAGEQVFTGVHIEEQNWLVAGGMSGHLVWLDLENKSIIKKIAHHKKSVFDIIRFDEDHLISASGDGSICIWETKSQELLLTLQVSSQGLRTLLFAKDGQLLVGSSDGFIYIIDPIKWQVMGRFLGHDNSVFALENSAMGLLSGGRDAMLKSWNIIPLNATEIKSINAHWYTINDILFDGEHVFTASRDKKIRIWTPELEIIQSLSFAESGHVNSVNSILRKDDLLISAGDDRIIILWEKDNQS